MDILLYILLFYLLYRFIFYFIIPVITTANRFKRQFREMQNQQARESYHQSNYTTEAARKNTPPSNSRNSDYIDFEEIK
jgi:hypothetical protein